MRPVPIVRPLRMLFGHTKIPSQSSSIEEISKFGRRYSWEFSEFEISQKSGHKPFSAEEAQTGVKRSALPSAP